MWFFMKLVVQPNANVANDLPWKRVKQHANEKFFFGGEGEGLSNAIKNGRAGVNTPYLI